MNFLFYLSSVVAIIATIMVITRYHPIHALLYLVVSFLAIAALFFSLGAPFVGVLEVIVYAGAIMVLFIFVVMMLNLDTITSEQEKQWLKPNVWMGPAILSVILLGEMIYLLIARGETSTSATAIPPKNIAISLFGEYVIAVELTGFLLMAGIVGAAHIGKHKKKNLHRYLEDDTTKETIAPVPGKTEIEKQPV